MTSNALVQFKLKPHPNLSLSLVSSRHFTPLSSSLISSPRCLLSVATNQARGVWRPAELTAGEQEERGAGEQDERGAGAQV